MNLRFWMLRLLAVTLLVVGAGVYSGAAVIAVQKERSAHSRKPARFHYVCPMHEDVTSKKRVTCPKCKMKLVKKPIVEEPTTSSN